MCGPTFEIEFWYLAISRRMLSVCHSHPLQSQARSHSRAAKLHPSEFRILLRRRFKLVWFHHTPATRLQSGYIFCSRHFPRSLAICLYCISTQTHTYINFTFFFISFLTDLSQPTTKTKNCYFFVHICTAYYWHYDNIIIRTTSWSRLAQTQFSGKSNCISTKIKGVKQIWSPLAPAK